MIRLQADALLLHAPVNRVKFVVLCVMLHPAKSVGMASVISVQKPVRTLPMIRFWFACVMKIAKSRVLRLARKMEKFALFHVGMDIEIVVKNAMMQTS